MKSLTHKICRVTFAVSLLSGLAACNKQRIMSPQADVAAANKIESSFSAISVTNEKSDSANSDLHLDHEHIQLQTSALEKEFLLQISLIAQPTAAMSSGLKSRVVAFRRRGDKVFLLEATKGHTVTDDLPQSLVLAEMQILSENENSIVIDFNKGMSQLLVAGEWRASDLDSKEYNAEESFASVPLRFSFIESASMQANHLEIRQIAQAVSKEGTATPVEIKYYLSPYLPAKDFEPTQSLGNFERFGFFEAAPLKRLNEEDIIYATKFNKKNTVVYACLLYTSPSPRDVEESRMPSSA